MIGAMNLCTWIGILASAGFYGLCAATFGREQIARTFLVLAVLVVPVLIWYRPSSHLAPANNPPPSA